MLNDPILIRNLQLKNRLVMPPMQSDRSNHGRVTDDLTAYYHARAIGSEPGIIIVEHCCISEAGRADSGQLSFAEDGCIAEHRLLTDVVHEAGSRVFIQLNHAEMRLDGGGCGRPAIICVVLPTLMWTARSTDALSIFHLVVCALLYGLIWTL